MTSCWQCYVCFLQIHKEKKLTHMIWRKCSNNLIKIESLDSSARVRKRSSCFKTLKPLSVYSSTGNSGFIHREEPLFYRDETFRKNLLRKYQNPSCWHLSTWIELIFTTFCTLFKMTLTFVSFSSFHLAVILPLSNCHRLSLWPIFHSISPFSIMLSHRQHTPNFLWQKSTVNSTSCIT